MQSKVMTLAPLLMLAGCAVPGTLQKMAIDQNQVVAQTADQLTLLNILRAKQGRPLHFTSISRISGNVDLSASGELAGGVEFAGPDAVSLSPSLGGSVGTNPNFDISIQDSQDFQRGIMQPVAPETINYYLRTGWRPDLITYIFVERIDFLAGADTRVAGRDFKKGEIIATLNNSPTRPAEAAQFKAFVACYTLAASQRPGEATPLKQITDMKDIGLSDLALLDGSKLDIGKGPDGAGEAEKWIVRKTAATPGVGLARQSDASCDGTGLSALLADGTTLSASIDRKFASIAARRNEQIDVTLSNGQTVPISVDLTFRSVDGVIYFLGEYARASATAPTRPIYPIRLDLEGRGPAQDLFRIDSGKGGRYELSATLNGESWHIADDCNCRSYRVITLVEQLVNLHKVGTTGPLSTAVRVIR
jgi:hypothetical protein